MNARRRTVTRACSPVPLGRAALLVLFAAASALAQHAPVQDAARVDAPAAAAPGATPGATLQVRHSPGPWVVVVHPANPARTLERTELERIYRRRTLFWPDGRAIQPLHLEREDDLRRAFTKDVLRSDEEELATWWNRQYYQGLRPPAVLHSSAAVRAYVAATPAAIGYLPPSEVDASVAVVEVRDGR